MPQAPYHPYSKKPSPKKAVFSVSFLKRAIPIALIQIVCVFLLTILFRKIAIDVTPENPPTSTNDTVVLVLTAAATVGFASLFIGASFLSKRDKNKTQDKNRW